MYDSDAIIRNQYLLKPLCDLDNKHENMARQHTPMPSIIVKYGGEEDVLLQINCA